MKALVARSADSAAATVTRTSPSPVGGRSTSVTATPEALPGRADERQPADTPPAGARWSLLVPEQPYAPVHGACLHIRAPVAQLGVQPSRVQPALDRYREVAPDRAVGGPE